MQHLNMIDFGLIAIFIVITIVGILRGFVREIISLLTFIIAFFAASLFASPLARLITNHETVQKLMDGTVESASNHLSTSADYLTISISFAVIFIGIIVCGWLIGTILNLLVTASALGFGNRLFGGLFGMTKGLLLCVVVIFVLQLTPISNRDDWQNSYLVEKFQPIVLWMGKTVSPALEHMKKQTSAFFNHKKNDDVSSLNKILTFFQ